MAFPDSDLDIIVEAYLGADPNDDPGDWPAPTDLSSRLMRKPIGIRRGRGRNQNQASAGACTLWLENTDGALTPLLATSTYYPDWDLGCPLRVSVDNVGANPPYVRHAGFIAEVNAVMIPGVGGENISAVQVTSAGVFRRLAQGSTLQSLLKTAILADSPTFYWPMEDGADSTSAASAKSGKPALRKSGTVAFADDADVIGSMPIPTFDDGSLAANLSGTLTSTQAWSVEFSTGTLSDVFNVPLKWAASGTFFEYHFLVTGGIIINAFDSVGNTGVIIVALTAAELAAPHNWVVTAAQNGTGIDYELYMDGVSIGTGNAAAHTLGTKITSVQVNPFSGGPAFSLGHLAIYNTAAHTGHVDEFGGLVGEEAHVRIARVCAEEGVAYSGTATGSVGVGPQPIGGILTVALDAETVDHGLLNEDFNFGISYRASTQRYNLQPSMTVDLSVYRTTSGTQADVLAPVRNDARMRNEWTITRPEGSSATVSGAAHITKRGRYADSATVNVEDDDRLMDEAGWRVHEGTFDGLRYDILPLDLGANASTLLSDWLEMDLGDRIDRTDALAEHPTDDVTLQIEGYAETIQHRGWTVQLNAEPFADIWRVGVLAEETMTLLTAADTTSTTWRVACDPSFTTDSTDLPVSLIVGGEVVTVTAVSAVAVSLANGTPSHGDNANLTPANPSHVEGDLLLLFAAIRNSGTGTIDTPAGGWSSFVTAGNIEVFYLYATSAATPDPTVVFVGGVAGATTSAVVIRARGCQFNLAALNTKPQLNGSAQDIAYPVYVVEGDVQVFNYSWKQDDYTSVAVGAGGMAEQLEASTTTGDDQSLYIARLSTSVDAFPIVTGSHTVTGGAAAISRSVFFTLLRGVADLTVTRSVNGVVATHARGSTVQVYQPAVLAL